MSITLGKVKQRGIARADLQGGKFISDDELTEYANAALAELFDVLVQSFEDHIDPKVYEVTTAAGTESYSLPSDLYKIRKVRIMNAAGYPRAWLTKGSIDDIGRDPASQGLSNATMRYFPLGTSIYLSPIPAGGDVLEVWYIPRYEYLSDDSAAIHYAVPVGWTEYVVLGIAMRCRAKEQTDASDLVRDIAQQLERIKAAAANRDVGEPDQVVDKSRRFDHSEDWF